MSATKRDLLLTRVFNASTAQLWRAWTDPDHVMRWWGPACFTSPSAKMDVRVGGTSIVCMRAPKDFGGRDMYNTWVYTKIVPGESIEFIQNLSDSTGRQLDPASLGLPPEFPIDQRNLVTFTPVGENETELNVTQFDWIVCPFLDLAENGWKQTLDKLAAIFLHLETPR